MPAAVERVRVRLRRVNGRVGGACIVGIAHQVRAALDFRRVGAEQRRIRRLGAARKGSLPGSDRARPAEVGVRVVHPGVDDRDAYVLTVQPGRALPRLRRTYEGHAFHIDEVVGPNRFDFDDSRQRGELPDLPGRPAHLDAVDGVLELPQHGAAHSPNGRHDRVLPATQVALDRLGIDRDRLGTATPRLARDFPADSARFVVDASGYASVIVNGEVLLEDGRHTGALSGQVL